jgi:glutaminyl-peptide cyclotransferase
MQSYGWFVEQHSSKDETPYGVKNFVNIVSSLPIGSNFYGQKKYNDSLSAKLNLNNRIVFACHYDSKYETSFEFLGAIDSAVPCAMLLDLAKFLKQNFDEKQFSKVEYNSHYIY